MTPIDYLVPSNPLLSTSRFTPRSSDMSWDHDFSLCEGQMDPPGKHIVQLLWLVERENDGTPVQHQ